MTSSTVAAAILAGGQARRFGGRDKTRLVVGGRPIIVRQMQVLQRVTPDVFIVASQGDRFADLAVPVHPDLRPGTGTLGGIHTALEVTEAERVLVVAADQPFLSQALLAALVRRADEGDGAWVATARGVEPLIACYCRSAAGPVRDALDAGQLKSADLGRRLRMVALAESDLGEFGPIEQILTNINTPDDYARVK